MNSLLNTISFIGSLFTPLYHLSAISFITFVLILFITHFISWYKRKPIKLKSQSLIVIVGACTGIGKVMAIQAAKKYHSKIIIADFQKNLFQSLSKEITNQCAICQCIQCNLTDRNSVNNFIKLLKEQNKKIDLLIYNAGILIPKLAWDLSNQERQNLMKVNYFSVIQIINGTMDLLQGGHISVVASLASIIDGGRYSSIYVASKHAIYAYLCAFRQQLKKQNKNITVSIGCPYAIDTGMFTGYTTKLDWLFPMMNCEKTGKRLLKEFVERKQVCFVYQYEAFLFKVFSLLPTFLLDYMSTQLDRSDFSNLRKKNELKQKQQKQKNINNAQKKML